MARQNRFRMNRGRPSRTRMLDWTASLNGMFTLGANVVGTTILLNNTIDAKITCFRIVGNIVIEPDAAASLIRMGVYKAVRGQTGTPQVLDPDITGSVENDTWLWWTSHRVNAFNAAVAPVNIPVDIKVKRILEVGERINIGIVGDTQFSRAFDFRILSKVTGTR